MSIRDLQVELLQRSFNPGPVDNQFGGQTLGALMQFAARRTSQGIRSLALSMAPQFAAHEISNRLRIIHAVAQACHESGYFKTLYEYGGPGYCARYDGRADLGNTQPGDGFRFRGRGIVQITGRDNYTRYGKRLGIDLIASPDKAAEPDIAAAIFALYWTDKGLNAYADKDDGRAISRAINRGSAAAKSPANHEIERLAMVERMKAVWPA